MSSCICPVSRHNSQGSTDQVDKSDLSSFLHQYNEISNKYGNGNLFSHRARAEIARNRPSTAIRRHVKKISEDFTITPTQHKRSSDVEGILIQIDSSTLVARNDRGVSQSRNTIFSPKTPHRKVVRSDPVCLKCKTLRNQVIPLSNVNSTPKVNSVSLLSVSNTLHPSKTTSNKTQGQNSPASQTPSQCQPRQRRSQTVSTRFLRRRKSQSATAGGSNGILKVPYEQVKKAKLFAEKAVKVSIFYPLIYFNLR